MKKTNRRIFLRKAAGAGVATFAAPSLIASDHKNNISNRISDATEPFKLKYAPGLGMFSELAGKDPLDNIKFCHDQGFRAVFDNGFMKKSPDQQEKIAQLLRDLNMDFGPYILYANHRESTFVRNDKEVRNILKENMEAGVDLVKRIDARLGLIATGTFDLKPHIDYQTANVIDNLRFCADIVEPAGTTIVIEPLNTLKNHPGSFLTGIPQAYQICRAINRKSVKIVDDIYHQQITEGNIIPNIEMAWDEIASFHVGDNPGRKEPTTGEINYMNIFKYLHDKNYDGVICMEHGKSLSGSEGEKRVIAAYRECDDF